MPKYSIWSQQSYYLNCHGSLVCFRVKVELEQVGESSFNMKLLELAVNAEEEPFLHFLFQKLPAHELISLYSHFKQSLLDELQPESYSLFYTGTLQDANYTPAQ